MSREEIASKLLQNHNHFMNYVDSLPEDEFMSAPEGKWTAGQHLDHIRRAVKPLTQAFSLPRFLLRWLLKKSNRPTLTYDALVNKYLNRLAQGGRASGRFVPQLTSFSEKEALMESVKSLVAGLSYQIVRFSEKELDSYILPHPLLKNVTIREMMYFTIYHVEHHHHLLLRDQERSKQLR